MKRAVVVLAALTALFALSACRGKNKPADAPAYPVKIETVDGIRTVLNPEFPREGEFRYALQDDLAIGGEEGDNESVLNRPKSLDVDAQGNIYVMDWGDVDIKVFAPDGRPLRTIGKKGQGPGEFNTPAYFAVSADGRIFLLSGRQNMVTILDNAGHYISSFRVSGFSDALAVDRQNRIYYSMRLFPGRGSGEEFKIRQNRIALFRADETGREHVQLGEFLDVITMEKVQGSGKGTSYVTMGSPDAYTTSWLVGPDDRVYLGYTRDYLVTAYDPDWKPVFRFGREFTPIRHPLYSPDNAHPEFYPAFYDSGKFFDDKGNLWLKQYARGDSDEVQEHVFDVFSPEGIYLKQVRVPQALVLVRGDAGFSIIRTEDDLLIVKRFRMVPE